MTADYYKNPDGTFVNAPLEATSYIKITVSSPHPHIEEPTPIHFIPGPIIIAQPSPGEQEPLKPGPVVFPGPVLPTGELHSLSKEMHVPCGNDELYRCCTLEEALRIGCRFAPAVDPEARLCNITWDYMKSELGWENPFVDRIDGEYFNEELDLFNQLVP